MVEHSTGSGQVVLTPVEQRVLGVLLEKQRTVPDTYPMTVNAVRTGCNQRNSREPLTEYSDAQVEECLRELKRRELVRIIVPDRGQRVLKHHQRLDEQLGLAEDERALVTVLLLRGPQSPGELKTRTERLHPFTGREAVEECLARLAARVTPLVRVLPRQPGHHDARWVHLLGPVEAASEASPVGPDPAAAQAEREAILSDGPQERDRRVMAAYDEVAAAWEHREVPEAMEQRPFDAWLLGRVAALAQGAPVCDVGCGVGESTAVLAGAGADVTGLDASSGMVRTAARLWPRARFESGDLRRLMRPPAASAWGALTAWDVLGHLAPSELPEAVAALARVLAPGGPLALAVQTGSGTRPLGEAYGVPVEVDLVLHDPAQVRSVVEGAGLEISEWYQRGPVGDEPGEWLYVLARMPA